MSDTSRGVEITPPFFEVGPKAYMFGPQLMDLALRADALSEEHGVDVILTPQFVDIPDIARAMRRVRVFAQHMDPIHPGRGIGSVLPEALSAAGATGVLLNHAERRISRGELARTMQRAAEVGLATMVCADNVADATEVALLGPDVIIVEEPSLIGTGMVMGRATSAVMEINAVIKHVSPTIRVLQAAGIGDEQDVYDVIAAGAEGTGSTSAIFCAAHPAAMLEAMIKAVRSAWDSTR